jgi:hypothetical protein
LKGTVPLAKLATKLNERDAQHDLATKELWVQAHAVAGMQGEVGRLKGREEVLTLQLREDREQLEAGYQVELRRLWEAHQKEIDKHTQRYSNLVGQTAKLTEDYHR